MYLTQGLHRAVQSHPERVATICGERRHSYRQYADRVARLAAALQQLGMNPGDRVGMLALNSDRYLEFFYGAWWGGGVVNPVNIRWSPAEIAYSLDDCDTRILLVDEQFRQVAGDLKARSRKLETLVYTGDAATPAGMLDYEELLARAAPMPDAGHCGDDLAAVMYTGGTTGFPKGVMLSHRNLASNALCYLAEGVTHADGRALLIAPMFHIAIGALMHAHAMAGGTQVIVPAFAPLAALQAMQQYRPTHTLMVPTMIQLMTDHPDAPQYDLSSLEVMAYGGSVISEAVLKRAMARFPNAGFIQAYGMTEIAPCATYLKPAEHRDAGRPGLLRSAGRASLINEVRIVDAQGAEVARGTVGEVTVRGPNVMLGYWNKPDQTAAALRDGWMHTGDGGYMDGEGYLYIVDRMKDMIVSGGENVYSAEVENALSRHPAVAASAVIGIPSEQWGEAVHAVVVLKPGAGTTAAELSAHCHRLIAGYKCPRSVEFRDALPMTGAGKIQKTELRKPWWEGRARAVN
ncbi:MAG TPA: long-chain-fatty-acid--CoA ligase [Burkholderiales bacterium]|nr:long-chain-fatty-acid--CoA ligase [Burkholderiales bacterium]